MYKSFFSISKESETISTISKNLSTYGLNYEAAGVSLIRDFKSIASKAERYLSKNSDDLAKAGTFDNIMTGYGNIGKSNKYLEKEFNKAVAKELKDKYGLDHSFVRDDIIDIFNKPKDVITKIANAKNLNEAQIDALSIYLKDKYIYTIKRSLKKNDDVINRYISEELIDLIIADLKNGTTTANSTIKRVYDTAIVIKSMRMTVSSDSHANAAIGNAASEELMQIIGTLLKRRGNVVSPADMEKYLDSLDKPIGANLKTAMANFEREKATIYGVDKVPNTAGKAKDATPTPGATNPGHSGGNPPLAEQNKNANKGGDKGNGKGSRDNKGSKSGNKSSGGGGGGKAAASKEKVNKASKEAQEMADSTKKVLGIIAGLIGAIGIGSFAYVKITED